MLLSSCRKLILALSSCALTSYQQVCAATLRAGLGGGGRPRCRVLACPASQHGQLSLLTPVGAAFSLEQDVCLGPFPSFPDYTVFL